MGITHFEIISEYGVVTDLEGRDTCAFGFSFLYLEKIILAVSGDIPEFVKFCGDS